METSIFFEEDKKILNILIDCDENNKENCYSYCEQFYYTNFNSIWDVDFQKIAKMYEFLYDKVMSLKLKTTELINLENLRYFFQDIQMEKSDQGVKSIDGVYREILVDLENENAGQNPYIDGTELNLDKEFN